MPGSVEYQTTVAAPVAAEGWGLHTGARVKLRLLPAKAEEGICFRRLDLPGSAPLRVTPQAVHRQALQRRTELIGEDGVIVATAEHFLAACRGLGLDHVHVELDGPELPIFDGSAQPFADLIHRAGLAALDAPRRVWRLRRPVTLIKDRAEIIAVPAERMELAFFAPLRHAGLDDQSVGLVLTAVEFEKRLAPARTFCFYDEVERLRAAGLIKGGSLSCALVIRNGKPIEGDYRLPNELACHKLVDLIGDLAVLGCPIAALITARGSGHALNHEFIEILGKELLIHD